MKTLRRHLSLLVVGALVPLIALAVALTVLMVRDARSTAEEALHQNAWLLSLALDGELLRSLTAMQALAQNDSLRRGDLAAFYNEALHARDSLDIWDNVILASPRGAHLFNLLWPYGTVLPPLPNIAAPIEVARTHKPYVSNASRAASTRTGSCS